MKLKKKYQLAKEKKVGETAICPSCNTSFIKTSYQQVFCKTKSGTICKDFYWNNVTPNKRNNTTRISPANQLYYEDVILPNRAKEHGFPDVETMKRHIDTDEGRDALSVEVENCEFCGLRSEYCDCGGSVD